MLIANYDGQKVADYLRREKPGKVCLVFWHGLGDLILFIASWRRLQKMFPGIQIDIALQDGVGQEELLPNAILVKDPNRAADGYDYTFQIHFPMAEHLGGLYTKQGWCCKEELGIDPVDDIAPLPGFNSKLVACHFQATALPGPINPSPEVAELIWNEILGAGLIPIEAFFQHRYFNPVNEKFDFIDCTIRSARPSIISLIGLYQRCAASICVASGNLVVSLAIMSNRTLYLEKEYKIESYTKEDVSTIDINNYQEGGVKEWLCTKAL